MLYFVSYVQLDEASTYIKALETKLTEKSLQQQQQQQQLRSGERVAPAETSTQSPLRLQQQSYPNGQAYQLPSAASAQHQSRLRSRDEMPPVSASSSSRRLPPDGHLLGSASVDGEFTDRPLPSSTRVSDMQQMIEARDALIREDRQLMNQSLATLSSFFAHLDTL